VGVNVYDHGGPLVLLLFLDGLGWLLQIS
jgi:hypothetical protein